MKFTHLWPPLLLSGSYRPRSIGCEVVSDEAELAAALALHQAR
jgi:hypothetical protein